MIKTRRYSGGAQALDLPMTQQCEALEAQLLDDGTRDTVIRCKACGWIARYSQESDVADALASGDELLAYEITSEDHWLDYA